MTETLEVRQCRREDWPAIESLYPAAFPDEDLLPLVRDLLNDPAVALSFVAEIESDIVGHAIFTRCGVAGLDTRVALLGPLAVAPAWQRRGVGTALVETGLRRLRDMDASRVFVLGDPAYYGRLGFRPESRVEPPFTLPDEWIGAWQSQVLLATATPAAGKLSVPTQWQRKDLWAP